MKEHRTMLVKMSLISSGQAEGQFDCYWREVFPSKVVAAEAQLSQENKQRQMPKIIVWFFFLDSVDWLCKLL